MSRNPLSLLQVGCFGYASTETAVRLCRVIMLFLLFYAVIYCLHVFDLCWAETCGNAALENIAKQDQNVEIQTYADKLAVIKEVLARRHMKVAFFGR